MNSKPTIYVTYCLAVSTFKTKQNDYWTLLDEQEQLIATRFKLELLRERYVICHGLLREVLANYIGVSADSLRIDKAEWGKPYLKDYPELSFNMSHSGDCLLIALGKDCQIGVDIEVYKARNTWAGLVKKCFSQEEIDYWMGLDPEQRGAAFYDIWVQKEALVKAVGQGITLGLNQCVTSQKPCCSFLRLPKSCGIVEQWQVEYLMLASHVHAAVISNQQKMTVSLREYK